MASVDPASAPEPAPRPFAVPCRRLGWDAPWRWLALGWRDLRRAPGISLAFGAVVVVVSLVVAALAWSLGRFALLATLLSGFVFVAPLLAVGLYCVSRSLERGLAPSLRCSCGMMRRVLGQAGVYALVQGVVILLWSRAGMMLSALWPMEAGDRLALFEYLLVGSGVGAVFAALTFAISAFSLPMIADRDVDMVTACVSSVNAVLRNKPVMLLWGALLVAITALAFATALLGLAVAMPWLAYATWHGYRETLLPNDWPSLE
ncbi:DUF2189 domain-containing protein [Thermomonas flagellata]|uniref:DUF2189 domain-containing protein n=1 Tax=Thermomonas flagellata TaxID=2888524 RepID=UPI001F047666|nr:DUF2189 domain-containing protein [Thermomonas flagellata]